MPAHRPLDRARRGASRRMIERSVTLLPEPDSPTRPSTSPGETSKLTSSTALHPTAGVAKLVVRSRPTGCGPRAAELRRALIVLRPHQVGQAVAEQAEAETA